MRVNIAEIMNNNEMQYTEYGQLFDVALDAFIEENTNNSMNIVNTLFLLNGELNGDGSEGSGDIEPIIANPDAISSACHDWLSNAVNQSGFFLP